MRGGEVSLWEALSVVSQKWSILMAPRKLRIQLLPLVLSIFWGGEQSTRRARGGTTVFFFWGGELPEIFFPVPWIGLGDVSCSLSG